MFKKGITVREAAEHWVSGFNAIPKALIEKAYGGNNVDGLEEITPASPNDVNILPKWGTMWTFGKIVDEVWARKNLKVMAKCGFRIYKSNEIGICFGIDGGGYDFYEAHWIPLYKARGLQWHDDSARRG